MPSFKNKVFFIVQEHISIKKKFFNKEIDFKKTYKLKLFFFKIRSNTKQSFGANMGNGHAKRFPSSKTILLFKQPLKVTV